MVVKHNTLSDCALQMYEVWLKDLLQFSSYRADTICDGQMDRQTDARGKNNMSLNLPGEET